MKESGIIDEYHDDGTIQGTITDKSGNNLKPTDFDINDHTFESDIEYDVESSTMKDTVNGKSNANANMNSIGANANSNSSDVTPSIGTDGPLSNSPSSSSNAESQSVSKSYELNEIEKQEFIPSVFFVFLICLLLVIGYKKKNDTLEE